VSGPSSVVISGDAEAVERVAAGFAARGVRAKPLRVSHAFHSARMDPVLDELGAVAAGLEFMAPRIAWADAVSGGLMTGCAASYWVAQARQPVRFADAVSALAAQGVSVFIEIGPDGTLSGLGPAALDAASEAVFVPLLRAGRPAAAAVTAALARAHVSGASVDWAAVLGGGNLVDLPTYAFQHQRYWPKAPRPLTAIGGDGATAEARFWAEVEGGNLQALSQALAVDGQHLSEVLPALAAWRRRAHDRSVTEGWRYRIRWTPVAEPARAVLSGTWLVVVPAGQRVAEADWCEQALAAAGADVIVVSADADRAALADRIRRAPAMSGVVSLLALDEAPMAGHPAVPGGLAGTLGLVQALDDAGSGARLWLVTRGAVTTGAGEVLASPVQAMTWGLGRVAALEYPDRWGGLVDLPSVLDGRAGARLAAVLAGCGEDHVAIRAAATFARRLVRAPLAEAAPARWEPRATVLITGGTGAIGGYVARWLAGQRAPRVALASRSGPAAAGAARLAAELAGRGTGVEVISCDSGDRAELAGLLSWIGAGGPPLCAVMHTAGVLDDGLLDGMDAARLGGVLRAKAAGAVYLDELTRELELEQFVMFSSAAATFGGAGQGNYAAANAFLDGLAQHRAAHGLAGLSVAWGPWAGGGVAESNEAVRQRVRRGPLPGMDPGLAVQALGQALGGPDSLLALMDVDWAQYAVAPPPFVRDLPEVVELARESAAGAGAGTGARAGAGAGVREDLARKLAGLPRAAQVRVLTDQVRAVAANVLGHESAEAVAAERAFSELGLDSLTSLETRQQLNVLTGLRLPATLLFDYPTPAVLAEFLRTEMFDQEPDHVPVLEELDRLDARLSSMARDEAGRAEIAARLEAMTRAFRAGLRAGFRADPTAGATSDHELKTASNDEMFDLLDRELRDSDFD